VPDAARIAVAAVRGVGATALTEVRFVLFSPAALAAFERALGCGR
jgi:O-acetyl-ADP-ribose deacetylase